MAARSRWIHLGLAVVGLAFVVPATAAFAADVTPSAPPSSGVSVGTVAQPGVDLSQGTLRLLSPDSTDDGPAVVLRSAVSHVSTIVVAGTPDTATSGYATPVRVAGAVPAGAEESTTGSRAPPAGR